MNPQQTEALRAKFYEKFGYESERGTYIHQPKETADFFLAELSQALEREREAVREKVLGIAPKIRGKSLGKVNPDELEDWLEPLIDFSISLLSPNK